MTRNRRRHSTPLQANAPLSHPAAPAGAESNTQAQLLRREVFKPLFEKILDLAKGALFANGTIGPMALFVYGKGLQDEELKESATKVVSISWKTEFQKEAVRMRIHQKAELEGASTVVLLIPAKAAGPHEGTLFVSGVMPGMAADASITYTFKKETKTFNFSEMTWRAEPVRNFFLEGIFSASGNKEGGGAG